jgi:hypothetical protein
MAISLEEMQAGLKEAAPPAPAEKPSPKAISLEQMSSAIPYVEKDVGVPDAVVAPFAGLAARTRKAAGAAGLVASTPFMLYDLAKSKLSGKPTTEAQDWAFSNFVDPNFEQADELEHQNAGRNFGGQALYTVGDVFGLLSQAVLTGPQGEMTAAKSGYEAVRQAVVSGFNAMKVPAFADAADIGRKVLAETGDEAAAVKAAQQSYTNSLAMGMAPASAAGKVGTRLATGAAIGVTTGEANRVSQNQTLPEGMQAPFTVQGALMNAFIGAGFGGILGQRPNETAASVRKHGVEAFDQLAKDAPEALDALASHVEQAEPSTAAKLRSRKKEALAGLERQRQLLAEGSGEGDGKPTVEASAKAEADLEALRTAKPGDTVKAVPKVNEALKEATAEGAKPLDGIAKVLAEQAPPKVEDTAPAAETIKSKPGVNAGRMAKMLGPQLYGDPTKMADVSLKELVQNSFDAVRSVFGDQPGGKIKISTDERNRSISLIDNGSGMTPELLGTKFLEIAGTGKDARTASGGFGIAKMLFLYGNDAIRVVTMRDGKVAEMRTSGPKLYESLDDSSQAPDITVRRPSAKDAELFPEGHGTYIEVKIPKSFKDPATGEDKPIGMLKSWTPESLERSPLFAPVDVSFNGNEVAIGNKFQADDYGQFANVKFDWGNARIYASNEASHKYGENLHVLSNGLWQFSKRLNKDPTQMWGDVLPFSFYVDVNPSVRPEDPGYPFTFNRQGFTATAEKELQKILNYVHAQYGYKDFAESADNFGQTSYYDVDGTPGTPEQLKPDVPAPKGKFDLIQKGDKVTVKDGKLLVNGREMPEMSAEQLKDAVPKVDQLKVPQDRIKSNRVMLHDNLTVNLDPSNEHPDGQSMPITQHLREKFGKRADGFMFYVGHQFKVMRDQVAKLAGYSDLRDEAVGLSLDKEYRGVSIRIPFHGSFINPLIAEAHNMSEAAYGMLGTMVHELAHFKVRGHDADFPAEMQRLLYKLEAGTAIPGFNWESYKKGFVRNLQQYEDIYTYARKLYDETATLEASGKRFADGQREGSGTRDAERDAGGREAEVRGQPDGEGLDRSGGLARPRTDAEASSRADEGLSELGVLEAPRQVDPANNWVPNDKPDFLHSGNLLTDMWNAAGFAMRPLIDSRLYNSVHNIAKERMSSNELLGLMEKRLMGGPVKNILKKLATRDDVEIRFFTGAYDHPTVGKRTHAFYSPEGLDPSGRYVAIPIDTINKYTGGLAYAVVHELVHANTVEYVYSNPDAPLVKQISKHLDDVRLMAPAVFGHLDSTSKLVGYQHEIQYDWESARSGPAYGLKNIHEFMAEAISNDDFKTVLLLAGKLDKQGIFKRFQEKLNLIAETIGRIMGFAGEETRVLQKAWHLTEAISDAQQKMMAERTKQTATAQAEVMAAQQRKIEDAFDFGKEQVEKLPGGRKSLEKLASYWDHVLRNFAPEALGPKAKATGAILASVTAREHMKTSLVHGRSAQRRAWWEKNHDMSTEFIDRYERGQTFSDPILQKIADGYRAWNERIFQTEQAVGLDYEAVDNYLYHTFKDRKKVEAYFQQKYGAKWGDPKFMKDRVYQLYSEALKAGFEPKYKNPEEIMLARQHASDIAIAKVEALTELAKYGLAKPAAKGAKTPPKGFSVNTRRAPGGQRYWIHQEAEPLIHNLYDTKSLWNLEGPAGDAFRGVMFLKNTMVPVMLGLSLFHAMHVQTIDNATAMVRATKELLSGEMNPAMWLANMGRATLYRGLISNPRDGYRLLKVVKGEVPEANITHADKAAIVAMAEGGFIPEMSPQYRTGMRHTFMKSVREHSVKAVFQLPFAAIDSLQSVMFEKWIPGLKVASYLHDVQTALRVDPTLLKDDLRRKVTFRKLAKSIDNRYGEMAYNTLFWNRWIKDIGVASTLSLGWNLGFLREYGGAGIETTKALTGKAKVSQGDMDRALFVAFYTAQSLLYGGLITYAMTGKSPEDFMDYIYPKSGDQNPDGTDQRLSTMFYAREFAAIAKHMEHEGVIAGLGQTAANKASPALTAVSDAWSGVNFMGQEIRDPNSPAYMQVAQTLQHTLGSSMPITIGTMAKEARAETPADLGKWVKDNPGKTAMYFAGFTPAPKYVRESSVQGAIKHEFQKYYGNKRTPYEKVEFTEERKELRDLYDQKQYGEFNKRFNDLVEKHDLTQQEKRTLRKSFKKGGDPYTSMFKRLSWRQQKRLLDEMSPEDRKVYLPHSNKEHLGRRYQPPKED